MKNCTNGPSCLTNGDTNIAPVLAKAARILDIEPVNVLLASFACSPKLSPIALENNSNDTAPLDAISLSSASVICAPSVKSVTSFLKFSSTSIVPSFTSLKYFVIAAAAFIPIDANWFNSSP